MAVTAADRVGAIAAIKPMARPRTPTAEYLSDDLPEHGGQGG